MHDEFEKIDWLKARFELNGLPDGAVVGIGDDAAVFEFGNRPTVVTVDTQVEGVHFRCEFISPVQLGERAMIAAVSDVWAMAAAPCGSVVALTLPPQYPEEDFRALIEGLANAARTTGALVVGGNLSRSPVLSITTTALGQPIRKAVGRRGARVGDSVFVTGSLGASALGFRILAAGRLDLEHAGRFIDRWRRPPMNGHLIRTLSEVATAAVDVSDGCLQDLGHICRASGVGADLRADALPLAAGFEDTCEALGENPLELALAGGEDYELLFTAPPSAEAASIATEIGVITEGEALHVVDADGARIGLVSGGFRHFS
jgi:thiamine-monophosphate kinase